MKEEIKKADDCNKPNEAKNATTISEFLSGLVEIGREKQGIRYSAQNAHPDLKPRAAH